MGIVTEAEVAAAQAAVDELQAKLPRIPNGDGGVLDAIDAVSLADDLRKLAHSELGTKLRFADKVRRELEVARSRQLAAIKAHEAAETALADRLAEMGVELTTSRQSLAKACNTGTLVAVEQAAKAHDDLVRRFAHELRLGGLHADLEDVQFDSGGMVDGRNSGLRIKGAWWLTCDPFHVGMWWVRGQLAAMHGQEFQFGRWLRDQLRLGMYDVRLDGLLDDVRLPKPAVVKAAPTPKRPAPNEPLYSTGAPDLIDQLEAAELRKRPPGHHDQVRREANRMRAELPEHLQKGA